jgi:6-phosphogluconolactonase (cycloisomerase 2 family)
LTRAPGTPFRLPEAEGPDSVKIDPSGRFAYVLNGVSNSISAFSINLQKQLGVNALTLIGVYPTNGLSPANLVTIDPSGLFLYASNRNSCNISGFAIDQNTGALTPISGSPFPTAFDVAGTCTVTQGVGDGPGTSTIF